MGIWGVEMGGARGRAWFLITARLAKVYGVFKVCLAQTVWGFLYQCCQDVGRKELCGEQRRESELQTDEINGQGAKDCGVSHRVLYPLPFSPVPSLCTEKQIYFTPFVLSKERP